MPTDLRKLSENLLPRLRRKMSKPLIVANWKMNPQTLTEAKRLFNAVKNLGAVICPPFVYLSALRANGAQDVFYEQGGTFTGQVSPAMLKNLGVKYVIIGHSERRALGETNEMVNRKVKAAISVKLKPILCVATLAQLKTLHVTRYTIRDIILAFEPLSAIGTGKPYSPEKAKKMRGQIKHPFVLYGGSVNSKNAEDYIKKAGFQGLLVGGASLNPKEFSQIVKNVSKN